MYRPFEVLEDWVREGRIRLSVEPVPEPEPEPVELSEAPPSDAELFEAAMRDVRPLELNRGPARLPEPVAIRPSNDEAEALEALHRFCRQGRIEPEHTREYVEHAADPVGRLYLKDLRSGRFAIQAHLDLHGLTVDEARPVVEAFLEASVRAGYSCVRVVHGRGRHSKNRQPLMKKNVERWLSYRRLARYVVAYTSARSVDGGGGAVYVLLRS